MLTQIESPKPVNRANPAIQLAADSPRFALFALGFRPFYLAAAMFGVLAVAWWWAEFSLGVARPGPLGGLLWHAHEMVFGFAAAVVAGFLLTAAQTWTGVPTPSGWSLAALVAVWAAGRLGMWWYGPATLWLDLLFLPLVAAALLRVLVKAGNRRNYFVVVLLAAWATCNAVFHACVNGWLTWPTIAALQAALFILVVLVTVIGGRVLPMFTANAVAGVRQTTYAWLDRSAIALTVLGLVLFMAQVAVLTPLVLLLAAAAHAARLLGWGALATGHKPILWILHVSYAWIPAGLALLALNALGWLSTSAAMHALAVGAVAGMMLGMMTRTSRGHTGRAMQATGLEVAAYCCIHLGALARVGATFAGAGLYAGLMTVAAAFWVLAFVLFLVRFLPFLSKPRLDGKAG